MGAAAAKDLTGVAEMHILRIIEIATTLIFSLRWLVVFEYGLEKDLDLAACTISDILFAHMIYLSQNLFIVCRFNSYTV